MSTAGIIVIGNEVLSGKVEEANAQFMIRELRTLGIELERIVVIRDRVSAIAEEVERMSPRFDHVFTSGGVGATHDDVTMEGVALGLGVPLVRNQELVQLIESAYGDRVNSDVLRMADVPEGTTPLYLGGQKIPIIAVRNVYVLPGVPEFLRRKFEALKPRLASGRRFFLQQIYVQMDEGEIAELLRETAAQLPAVEIGSYPRFDTPEYRVKITVESFEERAVEEGVRRILGGLPASAVVRSE